MKPVKSSRLGDPVPGVGDDSGRGVAVIAEATSAGVAFGLTWR